MLRTLSAIALAMSLASPMTVAAQTSPSPAAAEQEDPFLWLEEIEGERAQAWVAERNAASLALLQGDPRYGTLHDQALEILNAVDRIPIPGFRGEHVDNFWQDREHVRGLWRRTTLDSYRSAEPQWETVLDLDALAAAENANWVYKGGSCLAPQDRLCLVSLSDGGKDAVRVREYDAEAKAFVAGGFDLPESKGGATWLTEDELLISRDFGPGALTTSGYPMVVKRLRRGQELDEAVEVFRGQPTDVGVWSYALRDADGALQAAVIQRGVTFYETEHHLLTDDGARRLPLPDKVSVQALVDGWLVFTAEEDWTSPSGVALATGDLAAYRLDDLKADPDAARPELILRPGERESIEGVTNTRNALVVALYENVKGAAYAYVRGADGWARRRLELPENSSIGLGSASERDDRLFVSVSGYLQPSSLWLADAASGQVELLKSLPAKFDTTGLTVEQYEATSRDGTKIPYFVVRRENLAMDGQAPTLLYGYGGFQSSLLPAYSATMGKLWLERGGVYVVANTRGGGEFGPRWHQAALRENRQLAHDDFIAVAEDLIARKITSPRRLGIMGGSQGGLFVGAAVTQRPELFNAVVVQVPLFDMMRFHKLLAGASWIAEYGNPDIPEEREWIRAYSPYQNLKAGQPYPEMFIHTSTKDDRVHPGHARKAAARLEALGYPVIYYENTDGGHAAGANLLETARRVALEYTYLTRRLMD